MPESLEQLSMIFASTDWSIFEQEEDAHVMVDLISCYIEFNQERFTTERKIKNTLTISRGSIRSSGLNLFKNTERSGHRHFLP